MSDGTFPALTLVRTDDAALSDAGAGPVEPVELRRGKSACCDASMGHNVISLSQDGATILWVTSMT